MSSAARIEELQKKFDENPRRYFAPLANECRKAGDLEAAIAICRAHLPQQPGHMSGHIVYGQALFEAGELGEAKTVFETALALDPENLIALRHMGDIAARNGDPAEARQWYARVLDADPRNDEIREVLANLDTGHAAGVAQPERELPTLMDPALVAAAAESLPEPEDAQSTAHEAEELLEFEPTSFSAQPRFDVPGDEEPLSDARGGADDFSLDGFEATSFEPPARGSEEAGAAAREQEPAAMLDFEATGFGATGLEPTGVSIPPAGPEDAEADTRSAGAGGPSDGVPGTAETIAAPSFELEPADSSPLQDPPPQPPSADAFVTETMAELYLQQGYREQALEVYRQLVEQSPDDAGLRERMERVEREGSGVVSEPFARSEAEAGASRRPTIREFLGAVAAGRPVPALSGREGPDDAAPANGPSDRAEESTDRGPAHAGAALEVNGGASPRVAARPATLDSLFGSDTAPEDRQAADRLASAFSTSAAAASGDGEAAANLLSGRPAHPAGNDLSLDHVFGQPRHGGTKRSSGGFSFDQFFAEEAGRGSRGDVPEPAPETADGDDVEQFNSWLQGLKKQ